MVNLGGVGTKKVARSAHAREPDGKSSKKNIREPIVHCTEERVKGGRQKKMNSCEDGGGQQFNQRGQGKKKKAGHIEYRGEGGKNVLRRGRASQKVVDVMKKTRPGQKKGMD